MHTDTPNATADVSGAFVRIRAALQACAIPDADIEAEVLVRFVLEIDRAQYFANLLEPVDTRQSAALDALVRRRTEGEPLAYITCTREFYSLELRVDNRVLVPRQETELLVDLALELIRRRSLPGKSDAKPDAFAVADVCTGSGAIAIAIGANAPDVRVIATDLSSDAIDLAVVNATTHSMLDRVEFRVGDLLGPINEPLDLIVANPPYVPSGDWDTLPREVRREPRVALDGGQDGLDVCRRLLKQAQERLLPDGVMLVELMPEQLERAMAMARCLFKDAAVDAIPDFSGSPRVLKIQRGG